MRFKMNKIILYNIFLFLLSILYLQPNNCLYAMFINDNPPIIVDWSPKAGCTCVWKMLLDNYGLLEEALKYSPWIHHYRTHIYNYNKSHKVTLNLLSNQKYIKIKFVRNPYTRAISSYLHGCTSFKKSFEEFLVLIKNGKWQNLKPIEISIIKNHSQKQTKFTDKYMNYIIHIEDPDLPLQKINSLTGLNLSLDKYTSSHHKPYLNEYNKYVGNLPFIKREQYPPYYCYYSKKTLQLVEEIYKEDIANFGYSRPKEITDFISNNSK